jgi:hypothetical protein
MEGEPMDLADEVAVHERRERTRTDTTI